MPLIKEVLQNGAFDGSKIYILSKDTPDVLYRWLCEMVSHITSLESKKGPRLERIASQEMSREQDEITFSYEKLLEKIQPLGDPNLHLLNSLNTAMEGNLLSNSPRLGTFSNRAFFIIEGHKILAYGKEVSNTDVKVTNQSIISETLSALN